ncbi:MAG: hypothetical protein ACI8W8_003258 [Rhodothermales bacterium]|jgi:hypothetical protein
MISTMLPHSCVLQWHLLNARDGRVEVINLKCQVLKAHGLLTTEAPCAAARSIDHAEKFEAHGAEAKHHKLMGRVVIKDTRTLKAQLARIEALHLAHIAAVEGKMLNDCHFFSLGR